jgi:hypothetical protein
MKKKLLCCAGGLVARGGCCAIDPILKVTTMTMTTTRKGKEDKEKKKKGKKECERMDANSDHERALCPQPCSPQPSASATSRSLPSSSRRPPSRSPLGRCCPKRPATRDSTRGVRGCCQPRGPTRHPTLVCLPDFGDGGPLGITAPGVHPHSSHDGGHTKLQECRVPGQGVETGDLDHEAHQRRCHGDGDKVAKENPVVSRAQVTLAGDACTYLSLR